MAVSLNEIDSWTVQSAIDAHHASPMMARLAALREKYDLHMTVERFVNEDIGTDLLLPGYHDQCGRDLFLTDCI